MIKKNNLNKDQIIIAAAVGILSSVAAYFLSGLSLSWLALAVAILPISMLAFYVGDLRKFSFYLFVFLLPIAFQKSIFNPASKYNLAKPVLVLSISDLPLIMFFIITFLRAIRKGVKIKENQAQIFITIFFIWLLWSLLSIVNVLETNFGMWFTIIMEIYFFKALLIFVCVMLFPFKTKEIKTIVNILIIGIFIQCLIVFIQHFTKSHFGFISRAPMDFTFSTSATSKYYRASGTFAHVNLEAQYFSLVIPLVFSRFITQKGFVPLIFPGLTFLLSIFALAMTFSRGGWVGTFIACVFCSFFIIRRKFTLTALLRILFIIMLILLVLIVYFQPIIDRLTIGDEGATASRVQTMQAAFKMISHNPVLGFGLNNFQEFVEQFGIFGNDAKGFYWQGAFFSNYLLVHNRFLLVAVETGVIGLILFSAMILLVTATGFRYVRKSSSEILPLAAGFFSAFLGSLFYMQVEIFNDPLILAFFVLGITLLYNCRYIDLEKKEI